MNETSGVLTEGVVGPQANTTLHLSSLLNMAISHNSLPCFLCNTGLSKKMEGIWNRYNLKSTGRIYTFGVLKCSEKFKVLDLP